MNLARATSVLCVLVALSPTAESAPEHTPPHAEPSRPSTDDDLHGKVVAFVKPSYIHGVPYERAHRLGPEALPILETLLADSAFKPQWSNIVAVTAFVDAPRSFDVLTQFLEKRFHGEVDHPTYLALTNVVAVLGTVHDRRVGPYLMRGADRETWSRLRWREGNTPKDRLGSLLARLSLSSLSFSGTEETRVFLTQRRRDANEDWEKRNLTGFLERNEAIRREGLVEWTRRMNAGR